MPAFLQAVAPVGAQVSLLFAAELVKKAILESFCNRIMLNGFPCTKEQYTAFESQVSSTLKFCQPMRPVTGPCLYACCVAYACCVTWLNPCIGSAHCDCEAGIFPIS